MANHQKLTPFKTPVNYHQIDSFQDPMFVCSTKTVQIDSFQDPCIGLHSVFNPPWETPFKLTVLKSPWETTFNKIGYFRTILHSEYSDSFQDT